MVSTNHFRNRRLARNRAVVVRQPCNCPTSSPTIIAATKVEFTMEWSIDTPAPNTVTVPRTSALLARDDDTMWHLFITSCEGFQCKVTLTYPNDGTIHIDLSIDEGAGLATAATFDDAAGPPPTPYTNGANPPWAAAAGYTVNSGLAFISIPDAWLPFVP